MVRGVEWSDLFTRRNDTAAAGHIFFEDFFCYSGTDAEHITGQTLENPAGAHELKDGVQWCSLNNRAVTPYQVGFHDYYDNHY